MYTIWFTDQQFLSPNQFDSIDAAKRFTEESCFEAIIYERTSIPICKYNPFKGWSYYLVDIEDD